MYAMWEVLLAFGRLLGIGRKDPIEPVLDGYEGLTDRLERRVGALENGLALCIRGRKRLAKRTGQAIGELKGQNRKCETDRDELREQLNRHSLEIEDLQAKRLTKLPDPPHRTTKRGDE